MKDRKLKLFFDIDAAAHAKKSGVGYYSLGILEALAASNKFEITAHYFNFLGKNRLDFPKLQNVTYTSSKLLHRKLFNLLRRYGINIPIETLTRRSFDFSLFPNFTIKKSFHKTKSAVAVHDLAFIHYADTVSARNQKDLIRFVPKSINGSSIVITISQSTAHEIRDYYPTASSKKIVVTRIPSNIHEANINAKEILSKEGITGKFILFIGNMEPRKNLTRLVQAYSTLPTKLQSEYQLVVAGSPGWKSDETMQEIERLQDKGLPITVTGYVSEEVRLALYMEASIVVMPSLYEGYGMPIVEAMQLKKPVAISEIPVFREVAKDGAFYFDPQQVESMREVLETVLTGDPAIHVSKYPDILKDLNWKAVTEELIKEIVSIKQN